MSSALQLSGTKAQISTFVRSLTPRQKLLIAGSGVLVAALLFFFVMLISKPDYKPLAGNLSPADAQALSAKLAGKGIRAQVTADGTGVEVASDQLDKARLELSADGMPQGGRLGFELFDKPNWMGSDFAEKVNYQRALEGELERTISSIEEVQSARVHLVMEHESLFSEHEREAKAAVVLKLRRRLPPETATAITQLVANAVDGLNPDNVSLLDSDGRTPLIQRTRGPFATGDQGDLEAQLSQKLIATLEPVLGPDRVRANVRVEYDLATSDETRETYDPNSAVAITMQRSKERSPGFGNSGVPGTASNVPSTTTSVPKPAVTVTDNASTSETENGTYAVNHTVKHVSQPAGTIKRLSAALLVDDDGGKPRSAEEMKKIAEISRAALGIDTNRGDTLVAESVSFKGIKHEAPPAITITEKVTRTVHEWTGLLRVAGVLALFAVVYMLVLRPVKKQLLTTMRQLPATAKSENAEQKELSEGETRKDLRRELAERVKAQPETATRLLQSWIRQPEANS